MIPVYKKLLCILLLVYATTNPVEGLDFLFNPVKKVYRTETDEVITYRLGNVSTSYFKNKNTYWAEDRLHHPRSGGIRFESEPLSNAQGIFCQLAKLYAKQNPSAPAA